MAPLRETIFECLVRSGPDALIVTRAGRIVLVNDRAEELFAYRQDELLGKGLEVLMPERCRGWCAEFAAGNGPGGDHSFTGLRKDGG